MPANRKLCPLARFLLFVWAALLSGDTRVSAQVLSLRDSADILPRATQASFFLRVSSLHPVRSQSLDQPIDFGLTGNEWCAVQLRISPGDWHGSQRLCIDNTSLDSVFILQPEDGRYRELYRGGNRIRYNRNREWVWHTAGIRRTDEFTHYLLLLKASAQNINVHVEILSEGALRSRNAAYQRLIFLYLGCVGFMLLCAAVGYAFLRQRVLLYYAAYIVSTAGWIFAHYGYAYALLYPGWPAINLVIKPVMSLLAAYFVASLITALIPQLVGPSRLRGLLQALKGMALAIALLALLRLVHEWPVAMVLLLHTAWHVVLLTMILVLLGILLPMAGAGPAVKMLGTGFGLLALMSLLQMVTNGTSVSAHWLSEHGLLAAQVSEMMLLASAIVYQLFEERRDRDAALQSLDHQQRQTLKTLIGLQDSERRRIAQDLHDSIGPLLAAIKINFHRAGNSAKTAEEVADLMQKTDGIIDESIAEIRGIAHQLMPKGLSSKGLIVLLSDYFHDLESLYHTRINFDHHVEVSLPQDVQLNVYRLISELVLNAAKHSGAEQIRVGIETSAEACQVEVHDNGKGLPVQGANRHIFGLAGMQRRVAYLQGDFQIDSHAATGTCIRIRVPLFIPG